MPRISIFLLSLAFIAAGCSANRAKIDNSLAEFFKAEKAEGCFTMLDNASGKVTVYNMALDTVRFLPASTFKIMNSLVGIETGKITDENMLIPWDGKVRIFPGGDTAIGWNKDLRYTEAFKASSLPYFQEVARRIGKPVLQKWIDSVGYGNKRTDGAVDSFWINNTLKISPDEQLGLMKRLYFNQLPFQARTHQIVKDAMVQEDNTLYKLGYKTGWGFDEKGDNVGWVVGWIEENNHPNFFTLLVRSADKNFDMRAARLNILKGILKHYGFFEGKK